MPSIAQGNTPYSLQIVRLERVRAHLARVRAPIAMRSRSSFASCRRTSCFSVWTGRIDSPYVLGEILDVPAPEAADALGMEPAAPQKRLQRA